MVWYQKGILGYVIRSFQREHGMIGGIFRSAAFALSPGLAAGALTAFGVDIKPWLWWLIPLFAFTIPTALLWRAYRHGHALELAAETKVSMSFEPRSPWVVQIENSNIDNQKAASIWFRVRVDNPQSAKIAKDVRVSIVKIEYRNGAAFENTEFATSQILSWSNRVGDERFSPSDIIAAETRLVDVVSVDPVHNVIHVKWPFNDWLENQSIFARHGVYRLTVAATPSDGDSAKIRLLLYWDGVWENTKMELA